MARSEARISVDIWDDPDFTALGPGAQRMYLFLLSQKDLAHTGVLALRERRWARCFSGGTVSEVTTRLEELAAARFVVVDEDAEEVLVRSLIRRDKVYRQPNVLRNARDQLALVSSPTIRQAIGSELRRVSDEDMPDGSRELVAAMLADIGNPSPNPSENPSSIETDNQDSPEPSIEPPDISAAQNPSGNPSENPSPDPPETLPGRGPGERGMVTAVRSDSPSPDPRSVPPPAGASAAPTAGTLVAEWIDHCTHRPPNRVIGQTSKEIKALLDEGIDPDAVRAGLAQWHAKGLHPSALASAVNEVMNARPRSANGHRSTTDERVANTLAIGRRLQAQIDQQQYPQYTLEIEP